MANKEDIRITKSKRDLRNALMELLKTQTLEKLTVNEICSKALVNRMTFYKHYQDKYALLDDCIQNITKEIYDKTLGIHPANMFKNEPVQVCVNLLKEIMTECINKRDIIFSVMYCNNTLNWFIVRNSIEKFVKRLISEVSQISTLKYDPNSISSFLTGGFSSLILENLSNLSSFDMDKFSNDLYKLFDDILKNKIIFY